MIFHHLIKRCLNKFSAFTFLVMFAGHLLSQEGCSNYNGCCNNVNFNFNYNVVYNGGGTTAAVAFAFNIPNDCKGVPFVSAAWSFGDGGTTTGFSSIAHTYTLNTTSCATSIYTVTICLTDINGQVCRKQQPVSIQNPNTNSSHHITAVLSPNLCKTYSLSYDGSPIPNAQWAFGDGSYSPVITNNAQSITHVYPTAGTYMVTLTGDGISPCFLALPVTVVDFVSADFSYVANCNPATNGIQLNILNYNPLYTYVWTINSHPISATGQSGIYNSPYLLGGNNVIRLTITDPTGCSTSVSKIVTMGSPDPEFTLTSSSVCSGDMLSVLGVQPGADTYTWYITKPDMSVDILTGMNPSYVFNPLNTSNDTGNCSIILEVNTTIPDPANPGNTISCPKVTPIHTVLVNEIPKATFTVVPVPCSSAVTLNLPATAFTSYTLNYGDGTIVTGSNPYTPAHLNHTYSSAGIYAISLTLKNVSCTNTDTKTIQVSLPALSINATQSAICSGSNSTLAAVLSSLPSNAGTLQYNWSGPSNFNAQSPTITVSTPGTYQMIVTSDGACPVNLTASIVLNGLTMPVVSLVNVAFANCATATASATLLIPVGLLQQGYCINGTCTAANPSASADQQIVVPNLVEGNNYITITNASNSGCSTIVLANALRDNPVFTLNISQPSTCGGNGSANISLSSPGSPTVKWYDLADYPATSFHTGNTMSPRPAGNYVVEATDGFCVTKKTFNLSDPVINIDLLPHGVLATCPGNTIPVTANAAFSPSSVTGSFSYSWKQIVSGNPVSLPGTGSSINVGPGTYSLIVSANSCNRGYPFTVKLLDPIAIKLLASTASCKDNAIIEAQASGGDGAYTYQWNFTPVATSTNSPLVDLGNISSPVSAQVTIVDGSGCTAISTLITVTPAMPVTLQNCSGVGIGHAVQITACSVGACVTNGVAPYNFQWYKVGPGTKTVQWFFKMVGLDLVASNGTRDLIVTPPVDQADLLTQLALNADGLSNTVCYPAWDFSGSTPVPVASTGSTVLSTVLNVVETITLSNVETFIASCSGPSTSTVSTQNFTTGDYKLVVSDALGCSYSFTIGGLTFALPTSFGVSFQYVWGMDPVAPEKPESDKEDVVLAENMIEAANALQDELSKCMQSQVGAVADSMKANCLNIKNFKDALNLEYTINEHHYTLYYYDRAGQLTKTVPPEGINFVDTVAINNIIRFRKGFSVPWPLVIPHDMPTKYAYNSFGQLLNQQTPDGGVSGFIYDSNNRLRFSQNEKQKNATTPVYSYTKYDELGRIKEVGESSLSVPDFTDPGSTANLAVANNSLFPVALINENKQITRTVYSTQSWVTYYGKPQRYTQNRVSHTYTDPDPAIPDDEHYTYYSYDTHGNVEWLIQENKHGLGKNYIRYDYDLVSGKVLEVAYNENRADRFFHKYSYDAENRLTKAFTSRNGELWDEDASYQYYAHGPLKRNVIGEDHVQGLDYIYTIQGWIKSINTPHLHGDDDPGGDNGKVGALWSTSETAADKNGMVLNYFQGDYKTSTPNFLASAGTAHFNLANLQSAASYSAAPGLYNGNISSWLQSQLNVTDGESILEARADLYRYDVLNRIKESASVKQTAANSTSWGSYVSGNNDGYRSAYKYDANGNILKLERFDESGTSMDNITYTYDDAAGMPAHYKNRLMSVNDGVAQTGYVSDLEGTHTYTYDAIGNLERETGKEQLDPVNTGTTTLYTVETNIKWTVYGKIQQVDKAIDPTGLDRRERISFAYDASGNRSYKEVWRDKGTYDKQVDDDELITTYYVRDAQGNVMATYKRYYDGGVYKLDLEEQPIYGSDRIGQNTHKVTLASAQSLADLHAPTSGIQAISEYENWITTTNKTSLLPSSINDNLCQCKIKSLEINSPANTNYDFAAKQIEFLGVADNGIALAEDLSGQLQFYAVIAKKYLGNTDACLIFDRDGHLMKGTEAIALPYANAKPVIVNIPGTTIYAVVTSDAAQKSVYHLVDMSATGYALVGSAGEVTAANLSLDPLTAPTALQGMHYTAIEDHVNTETIVYGTRFTPSLADPNKGNTEIVSYRFTNTTSPPSPQVMQSIPGCFNTETGELQISPDGSRLAWYQHDKSLAGFKHRQGYIYTMLIGPDKISVTGSATIAPVSLAGNEGKGMLDFINPNDIAYAQRGLYTQGSGTAKYDRNVWRYESLTNVQTIINGFSNPATGYLLGEIRRGKDGKLYIPNMGTPADKVHAYTGTAWTDVPNTTPGDLAYELAGSLPTQVFKLFTDPAFSAPKYARLIGEKQYELKDHLGNVKMVLSDEKYVKDVNGNDLVDINDQLNPRIVSSTDYYPFGSTMPKRSFSSSSYRYGFNGKENDNEIKGEGNSLDFGARIYDSRLGRFLSLDPLQEKFPSESNYIFAGNSPIYMMDVDGKFKIPIHQAILRDAFQGLDEHWFSSLSYGISIKADIFGVLKDFHFDGRRGLKQVNENWKGINALIGSAIARIHQYNREYESGFPAAGFYRNYATETFGVLLHTVQDFYSHSNYVELYIEFYKSQHNGLMPTEVPIYEDGLKIKGFKKLMERTTYDKDGKFQGLYTGEFPEDENEFWDIKNNDDNLNKKDANSHYQTNKDKANTEEGKLAKDVATRHTVKLLKIFKKVVGNQKSEKEQL
jgi:RHS repeat-associated protein